MILDSHHLALYGAVAVIGILGGVGYHLRSMDVAKAEAKAAEKKLKDLTDASTKAKSLEEDLTAKEAADRDRLAKMRDDYKDAAATVKQAASDIKRLTDSCRQTYFALPQEYKDKLGPAEPADWSKAAYPDRHDITDGQRKIRPAPRP